MSEDEVRRKVEAQWEEQWAREKLRRAIEKDKKEKVKMKQEGDDSSADQFGVRDVQGYLDAVSKKLEEDLKVERERKEQERKKAIDRVKTCYYPHCISKIAVEVVEKV
jgi:hypothetical protein